MAGCLFGGEVIKDQLTQWATETAHDIPEGYEDMPEGVEDRAADMWEPLLLLAEQAGEEWPELVRKACVAIVTQSQDSTPSLGVQMLSDLREIFGMDEVLSTNQILNALYDIEEAPWAEMRGRPLDARGLAGLLKPYDVESTTVRMGHTTEMGYTRASLWDAWQRY